MEEFKVTNSNKWGIFICLLLILAATGSIITAQFKIAMSGWEMILTLIIELLMASLAIYWFRVLITINKDKFKKIVIDNAAGKFLLITSKKEILALPFEDISVININKGGVIQGIFLGYVTLITKEAKSYGVTISKVEKFCIKSPKEIDKNFADKMFYQPKWNKK